MAEDDEVSTTGAIDAALRQLLDDEHHQTAVDERRRRTDRRARAAACTTFAEIIQALAHRDRCVEVHRSQGDPLVAVVCEVGRDYLALREHDGTVVLVPASRVVAVCASTGAPSPVATRAGDAHEDGALALDLPERLRDLAARRVPVALTAGTLHVRGELHQIGADAIAVIDQDAVTVVVLDAVDEVRVEP